MDPRFQYEELTALRQFRLLKILSTFPEGRQKAAKKRSPRADLFAFDLITMALDKAPKYEPVSYVWGSGDREARLPFLTGGSVKITQRLSNSLKELSKECSTGYL